MKNFWNSLIVTILALMVVPIALAWGMGHPYIPENPLIIKAGNTEVLQLELQNMEETPKLIAISVMDNKSATSILQQEEYSLEPMGRTPLLINLTIDKYAHSGNYTTVIGAVSKSLKERNGQVGLSSAVTVKVNYEVLNPFMDFLEMFFIISLIGLAAIGLGLKVWTELWMRKNLISERITLGYR